jgi:hypothetical protein
MTRTQRVVRPFEYVACYAAWLALCALGGLIVQLWLGLMLQVSMTMHANQWVAQAMRQLSLPILGLLWLILIFWLEHYLRTGLQRGLLWRRAGRVGAALLAFVALLYVLNRVL